MSSPAVSLRARESAARCPYCHDVLVSDPVRVTCEGCGTEHHQACLEELGRCPVAGCATPGTAPDAAAPRPATIDDAERLRRRVRERARRFAEARAKAERPPQPPPPHLARRREGWRVRVLDLVHDFAVRQPEVFLVSLFVLPLALLLLVGVLLQLVMP